MAGQLGWTTGGKGEVGGNSRIHLGKAKRRSASRARGGKEF